MYAAICSPFAEHFANSLNVYIQVVFIGKCSFHFGWRFISVVLFSNENTLLTSKLTLLETPFYCKMFVTMVIHKIVEVTRMRNET